MNFLELWGGGRSWKKRPKQGVWNLKKYENPNFSQSDAASYTKILAAHYILLLFKAACLNNLSYILHDNPIAEVVKITILLGYTHVSLSRGALKQGGLQSAWKNYKGGSNNGPPPSNFFDNATCMYSCILQLAVSKAVRGCTCYTNYNYWIIYVLVILIYSRSTSNFYVWGF